LNATSKRAHLSSKEFSTLYKIAGCSGSKIQHDQEIRDSNDHFFPDLQCKNDAKTAKSGKIDRSILFSPSASSVSCESSTSSNCDDSIIEISDEVRVQKQTKLYDFANPHQAHKTDIAIAIFFYRCGIPYACAETLIRKQRDIIEQI
jgi:hypothetical protein